MIGPVAVIIRVWLLPAVTSADSDVRQLTKGANVGLDEIGAELGSLTVILETGDAEGAPVEADVSVLLLGEDGRVRSNDDFVFYNQPIALSGAVHLRDKIRSDGLDGQIVSSDLLTLDLDAVPDDVQRIVLAASLDPALSLTFGQSRFARLRLQRTSDATTLVEYRIDDASEELALLFGEFYRRHDRWRLRAIGQGFTNGLAGLAGEFGVDVEPGEESPQPGVDTAPAADATAVGQIDGDSGDTEQPPLASPDGDPEAVEDLGDVEPPTPPSATGARVSVNRSTRAPRLPANWGRTVPAKGKGDHIPARLFPVVGIGTVSEAEGRASSALLAVMALVREFGRALTSPLGAPVGPIKTFTEVPFGYDGKPYRPDGLIEVTRGARTWRALVEVKASDVALSAKQIETYVEIAREQKFDAVLTISNQVTTASEDHPVAVDRRKLRKVALHHLSWDEIRSHAIVLTDHRTVADPTQRLVLAEFLRYMEFERSGMGGLSSMGKDWVTVRNGVKAKTLRPRDASTASVSGAFDQLISHVALHLTGLLGVGVQAAVPRRAADSTTRCQQLADSGMLFGVLRVPGAVSPMIVSADLRADKVTCVIDVDAPGQGRPLTRVNWLLRQLADARPATRVEANMTTRGPSTVKLLKALRDDPVSILPDDGREIRSFRIALDLPMGSKQGTGSGTLIGSILDVTTSFYAEVVQNLRQWNAKPPQLASSTEAAD